MLQNRYLNKLRELPEPVRQLGGLVTIIFVVILSFAILNIFWELLYIKLVLLDLDFYQ